MTTLVSPYMLVPESRFHSHQPRFEWLFVALVLSAFGVFSGYTQYEDRVRLEEQAKERLANQASLVADNLSRQLHSTNLALESVVREISDWRKELSGMTKASKHLKTLTDAMPGVQTMLILDAKGTVVASDKPKLIGGNFAYREYFQTVQKSQNPDTLYVSTPFRTSFGSFTMTLTRMVSAHGGRFDGTVVAALDPAEIKVILNSALYRPNMVASLIYGNGTLLLAVPNRDDTVGADVGKAGSFFTQHVASGQKVSLVRGSSYALEAESLMALMTVKPESLKMDKPLVIAIGRDYQSIFTIWQRNVFRSGSIFFIVALCSILGLIFYQKRRRLYVAAEASYEAEHRQAVELSEKRFRSLTKLSSDWYWEQDDQFRFVRLHGKLDQRTSIANEAHVGKTRWEMGAINVTKEGWERHRAVLHAHHEFHDFEMQRRDREGKLYWVSISGIPIFDDQGQFCGYRGVARDISSRKFVDEEIKNLAFFDTLTHLPNRRLFNDRLAHALAASKRSERYGALLFIDLDNFKPLNDAHGHGAGDLLLIDAAHRLTGCVREIDTVARFGGDEFAVIVSELDKDLTASQTQVGIIADKISTALARPYVLMLHEEEDLEGTVTHHCTASIGIALFLADEATQKEILKWADMAMYQAKADGRNLIRYYCADD